MPGAYLDQFLPDLKNGVSMDAVLEKIASKIVKTEESYSGIHLPEVGNYEAMKPHLMMRLCDPETSLDFLADKPWTPCGELATTYRFKVPNVPGAYVASAAITNELLEVWGITVEQLHADAVRAENEVNPIRIYELVYGELPVMAFKETTFDIPPAWGATGDLRMCTLTTKDEVNGASVIARDGVLEKMAERMHGNFFVMPTAISEVMVVGDKGGDQTESQFEELTEMLRDGNRDPRVVAPEDVLSDKVQYYDQETGLLRGYRKGPLS